MAVFSKIYNVFKSISKGINYVSMLVVFLAMLMLILDLVLRNFFNSALLGAYELTEMAMVIIIFCGFSYTQVQKGHVRVDILVGALPKKAQYALDALVMLFTTVVSYLVTQSSFQAAGRYMRDGLATGVLRISLAPFAFIMAIGMTLFTLILFLNAVEDIIKLCSKSLPEEEKKDDNAPVRPPVGE